MSPEPPAGRARVTTTEPSLDAAVRKHGVSPRKRSARVRGVLYGLLILLFVLALFGADWTAIQRAFFNPEVARAMFPNVILIAAKNTIIYTIVAFTFGLVLGLILALMKLSTIRPYRWIATGYIELLRGLPALVTL